MKTQLQLNIKSRYNPILQPIPPPKSLLMYKLHTPELGIVLCLLNYEVLCGANDTLIGKLRFSNNSVVYTAKVMAA